MTKKVIILLYNWVWLPSPKVRPLLIKDTLGIIIPLSLPPPPGTGDLIKI